MPFGSLPIRSSRRPLGLCGLVVALSSCATAPPSAPARAGLPAAENVEVYETPTTRTTVAEVQPARLCRVIAEVDDAASRNALGVLRLRYDSVADDRAAAFGSMLARPKNDERFRLFHDDDKARPLSVVGALGTCLVYSDWKMPSQRELPCRKASERLAALGGDTSLVRYADALLQWRQGDADGALATLATAIAAQPSCEALHLLRARVTVAKGADVAAQKTAWAQAEAAVPGCFSCAVESGKLVEQTDGKAAAAAAWERALKIVPDHPDTLRRLAAAVAGVDDARTLAAYTAAVDAGVRDFATLLAAAKLAAQLAKTAPAQQQALDFARKAVELGRSDPDARRLVVLLALRLDDLAMASTAGRALLELAPDDVVAHGALARAAMKSEAYADAALHYEAVAREVAAGRTGDLDGALLQAFGSERLALFAMLGVSDEARAEGGPTTIAQNTQRTLTKLWRKRVENKQVSGGGVITVTVETDATGRVVDVIIKSDPLGDKVIQAATVAALRRTTIRGGAKRYTLDFTLE
jgi:tetratricopeptide (TPR) repeat protein